MHGSRDSAPQAVLLVPYDAYVGPDFSPWLAGMFEEACWMDPADDSLFEPVSVHYLVEPLKRQSLLAVKAL